MRNKLAEVATAFQLKGQFIEGKPFGSGHINDTYRIAMDQDGRKRRYILQSINHHVFKDIDLLTNNIALVTQHLHARLKAEGVPERHRRALRMKSSSDGEYCLFIAEKYWRCYDYIENAESLDILESPHQAFEAARAFGHFLYLLSDFKGDRLHETIPDFHHTPKRLLRLKEVAGNDPYDRLKDVQQEYQFILDREADTQTLIDLHEDGTIPERITHNDTKISNVLLDQSTGEGICVIDFDTIMPGLALYDFGDLVRTSTCSAAEDERDLSQVHVRLDLFRALVDGYLSEAANSMVEAEFEYLAFSGKLITLEVAIRFLTDYLEGDIYFRTSRPEQNLDRCRNQLRMVECIEEALPKMEEIVDLARIRHLSCEDLAMDQDPALA